MNRNYDNPVYKRARAACLKRDKCCQMPQCGSRSKLKVHHIVRWADASSLRYELSNLITLCRTCHDSIKNKENHYIPLFQTIIMGK